jgi:SWI/SNF-related matrix-associated actin-dependent regulator 1 of chromatin subfamily A
VEIITTPDHFKIVFPYKPYLVEGVKQLPDRRFDPIEKVWIVPARHRIDVERFAHKFRFSWAPASTEKERTDFAIPALPDLKLDIPLKIELRHYQRGGVAYNLKNKKVIIGDDMGLGKTLQAIATVIGADILHKTQLGPPAFPCLVICPASVKYSWQDKWKEYTGRNFAMLLSDGIKRNWHLYYETGMAKVFIVNYESLKKYFVTGIDKGPDEKLTLRHVKFDERIKLFKSIIIDESHKVKDSKTQQSKFTKGIAAGKEWILALTGTPVINKPKDLIAQLGIIEQLKNFGGYKKFVDRYCNGIKEASNLRELNYYLNQYCFYRRSKQEVAKELPAKSRQIVLCDITNRKEYNDAEADLIRYLRDYKNADDEKIRTALRGEVMVRIGILKNISARGKLKSVIEYVDDVIENGEKIGIFVHLKEVGLALKKHYSNSASITGDDSLPDRQVSIHKFRNDPKCMTAILSIMAAGTGVDGLQYAACTAAFVEQPWTAAACDQAEDRFNRIGQTRPVNIIYFLGKGTIDEHIYQIIQEKRNIADTVTGNTDEVKVDFVNEFANLFTKE